MVLTRVRRLGPFGVSIFPTRRAFNAGHHTSGQENIEESIEFNAFVLLELQDIDGGPRTPWVAELSGIFWRQTAAVRNLGI